MLINSLVLLNRVEDSVTTIRERIPVELHYLVDRVIGEVEERYKAGLQTAAATTTGAVTAAGSSSDTTAGTVVPVTKSILTPGRRMQTQEILEDFVTTLYARFGSVLEYHKFVLETIGRLSRRPSNSGSGPGIAARRPGPAYALREVWMTIQSEIKSMLYDYLTTECAASRPDLGAAPAPAPTPSPGLVRDRANRRISGGTKVPGGGWLEDLIRPKATGSAQGAAAADGSSANAVAGNVGATPSGARQVFSFGQSEIKSTSEALYKPIEDEMRQLLSFTQSEGAQQQQQQQLVAQSAVVDRFAEGNGAAGHLLLVPPSVYHASVVLSPTTQFLARIGHVLLEPRDTQDFDEFLRHFFVRFFLPQVEAHALHLFTQMTSGSDAFYTHPTLVYRGRPVIKSAVAIVPLIHDLGRMLAAIPFYQEEYVMIVEKIIRKYFDECQTRFTEAITNSKYVVGAFGTAMLMASAGGGGNNPYPLDAMGGSGNDGLSAHTAMMSSSSAAATSTLAPHTTTQNDRAGPARQCIASRWANDDDLQQLLDMKFRLTLHDRTVKFDTRSEKEMAIEYRLKHDRSIHPSELMFDVKKMNFLATLHHSLEWFLLNVHFSRMSQVPLGGEVVDADGGGDGVGNDGGANGTRVGAADGESALDAADGNRLDLDMLAQMKGLRVRLDQLWDRHRTLATSCLVTLRIEMRCRCLYYLELATREGNYGLEEESQEPDQYVQTFNADLIMCEELLAKSLPKDEIEFIFSGLSHLISHILISNVTHLKDLNYYGSRKMIRNILALQQNLTSISLTSEMSGLDHALKYYELFQLDLDAVMHQVTEHDLVFTLEEYQFLLRFVYQNAERQLEIDSDQYELNYRKYKEAQRVVESLFKSK
ncbi:exocyst subunit [Tieghemiomyces parasiticus]|uniref:Exocyst complex component Sec8 n=1 Tax=Tieghemiomyces parasiticus TaxID=78921 RepID=A0A9W7ZP99_9FUNG|nr:exocyst subunit [Tieghemiomyces parasiticus]